MYISQKKENKRYKPTHSLCIFSKEYFSFFHVMIKKVVCVSKWKTTPFSKSLRRYIDGAPFFLLGFFLRIEYSVYFLHFYSPCGKRKLMSAWQHPPMATLCQTSLPAGCTIRRLAAPSSLSLYLHILGFKTQILGVNTLSLISISSYIIYTQLFFEAYPSMHWARGRSHQSQVR